MSEEQITKNQDSEGETKANLDATDSSQDSLTKSEAPKSPQKDSSPPPSEPAPSNNTTANEEESKEHNDTDDAKPEPKAEKSEEDEPEEEDRESGEEGEDDDKKEVPLLDQPLEQSGPRERKKVQRFNEDFATDSKEGKIEIPSGSGSQLGDIPRIDASISRFKTEDLKLLHKVLFKIPGKSAIIKKNIKKFNGFDFTKDSDSYSKKVQAVSKMELKQLKSICEMLDLEKNGKKEEISERICEFLLEPKDSGKPVGGGRPKRTAAVRANNRGYSSHDDEDDSDSGSKRASRSRRGKGKRANLKEESSSESDAEFNPSEESEDEKPRVNKNRKRGRAAKKQESEDEPSEVEETPSSDESEEPKSKRKRGPVAKTVNNKSKKSKTTKSPGKKAAAGKRKAESGGKRAGRRRKEESEDEEEDKESENNEESSSGDDEPLVKKSKSPQPPTDEEIKTYVKEILEGANLEEITMKTVCKQVYAHYPDFDLAHKKDFIKTTVKSLIST